MNMPKRRTFRRVGAALIAAMSLILTTFVAATPAAATFPGEEGRIAYVRFVWDGVNNNGIDPYEIWTVNPDGSDPQRLTQGGVSQHPAFSPDGSQIAFTKFNETTNKNDIQIIHSDGSNSRQLKAGQGVGSYSWSADGQRIASDYGGNIVVYDVTSGVSTNFTLTSDSEMLPQFSPDGAHIAYFRNTVLWDGTIHSGSVQLVLADAATGANPVVLYEMAVADLPTPENIFPGWLRWWPDGTLIETDFWVGDNRSVHVRVDLDGNVVRYDEEVGVERTFNWLPSPNGNRVAYSVNQFGIIHSYMATPDGEVLYEFTPPAAANEYDTRVMDWQAIPVPPPTDTANPTITVTSPTNANVTQNTSLVADYSCADEEGGSGIASCVGTVPDGMSLDTGTVGAKAFTVTATDNAGNTATQTVDYTVVWPFTLSGNVIDGNNTFNIVAPNKVVPVRFSLGGDRGLGILAEGYPKAVKVSCDTSAVYDPIESYTTQSPGQNTLSYDAVTNTYGYNWKTPKGATGCQKLVFRLTDGNEAAVFFQFK